MPNWTSNILTVSGTDDALKAFMKKHIITEDDDGKQVPLFDFNTIIPMPDVLKGTVSGSITRLAEMDSPEKLSIELKAYYPHLVFNDDDPRLQLPRDEAGVVAKTINVESTVLIERFKQRHADEYEQIVKIRAAREATGYTDWYQWSVACWGTKWNACRTELDYEEPQSGEITIRFDTALSMPRAIFDALVQQYRHSGLVFDWHWTDEFDTTQHHSITFDSSDGTFTQSTETILEPEDSDTGDDESSEAAAS